ncbi:hypothetical protein BC831DRAFT_184792 [Entophlyctis helioformis]|nr:hypothetical protein BC831DRAFT_184792 [Entophlyctis helioformis]
MPTGAHLAAVRARIRSRDTAAPAIRNISESVVQGLNRPLVDAHQCVESFNNYIDDISETWAIRGMQHVAPYGAMVQSSGMGKTRTCIEVAKQRFAIYTNLRDQMSTGYPLRSLIADRFKVIPISQFTHWSIGFLLGCINHLAASIESNPALTPSAWIALQVGRKVDVDQFWNDALVHIDSALAMIESDGFPKDAPASGSGTGRKKKAEGYLETAMANLQAKIEHLQQQQQQQQEHRSRNTDLVWCSLWMRRRHLSMGVLHHLERFPCSQHHSITSATYCHAFHGATRIPSRPSLRIRTSR